MFSSPKPFPLGLSVGVNFDRTVVQGYSSMTPQGLLGEQAVFARKTRQSYVLLNHLS